MATKGKTPPTGGAENDVGYGKPPQRTQFKRGKSGNPRGRPKGTKNLKTDLQEELAEKILVQEGDQARRMSKQRAVVKALVNRTLKGDARAASSLLSTMMKLIETGTAAEPEEREELHADDLEILEAYRQRILRADSQKRSRRSRSNKQKKEKGS
jgi:hypothetical protein